MSVGIDIGSKSIKIVELSKEPNNRILKAAGIAGIKNLDISSMQDEVEFSNLAATIKKLFIDAKVSTKDVNISLPESSVFTRSIKFPPLTDQEIASAVKWQAEEIIPIPPKDAIFQYVVLERKENAQPPEVVVLVVAAPRTLVEKYIKIMTMAGLNVIGVETQLLSLTRALAPIGQTALIVDIGARSTNIAVAKGDKLLFSRTIATAGDAFSRAVAQGLNVTPAQAEEYKITYGLSPAQLEGKVSNSLVPVFKIVTEEIKKAINFYQSEEKGEPPTLIILTGGGAGLPGITPAIAKAVSIEVTVANPFTKITMNPNVTKNILAYAPLYSVAVGLALRE